MSIKYDYKFFIFNADRNFSNGDEEQLDLEDIAFWSKYLSLISQREYSHEDNLIIIFSDWKPKIVKLKKELKEYRDYKLGIATSLRNKPPIAINMSVKISKERYEYHYGMYFVEHFIHEVFIVINLAWPGVCNFYNAVLTHDRKEKKFNNRSKINLSSMNFELAWLNSENGKFPKIDKISLERVIGWYEKIGLNLKQKANSSIEKVLFSLLHLSTNGDDITSVIWIFHALEALFSTKVGEGFTNLVDRISLLLVISCEEKNILKKKLRFLYDLRSSLVHGGYGVYHPLRNEIFDEAIDTQRAEMYDNIEFGISIIIASLQQLIKNDWYGINIEQNIYGKISPYDK